jgi:hypothetical protein
MANTDTGAEGERDQMGELPNQPIQSRVCDQADQYYAKPANPGGGCCITATHTGRRLEGPGGADRQEDGE